MQGCRSGSFDLRKPKLLLRLFSQRPDFRSELIVSAVRFPCKVNLATCRAVEAGASTYIYSRSGIGASHPGISADASPVIR